jgi:hypothetical protein
MYRIALVIVLTIAFAGCDAISTMTEGLKYATAVGGDIEQATGVKPQVAFNSTNGRLVSVTVTFPGLYESKPLPELAAMVRAAVSKEFKQQPENIVLAFTLKS